MPGMKYKSKDMMDKVKETKTQKRVKQTAKAVKKMGGKYGK